MFSAMATDGGSPWDRVWTAITGLESRVEALEEKSLPQGFVNAPAYDSGWIPLPRGEIVTLEHGLGTTEVFVYLIGKYDVDGTIHQWMYGGGFDDNQGAVWFGLTDTHIKVERFVNDVRTQEGQWNQIRVMIWRILEPPT